MPTSWKHTRDAKLWLRLEPAKAGRVLVGCYGAAAGEESLLRAFLAERDRDRATVLFWIRVYSELRAPAAARPPSVCFGSQGMIASRPRLRETLGKRHTLLSSPGLSRGPRCGDRRAFSHRGGRDEPGHDEDGRGRD